jgi:hypothetical protein
MPRSGMPAAIRWPQLRAAFVLFHVLMVVVLSLPRPGELDKRSAWQKPRVQRNFAAGTRLLRGLGLDLEDGKLQAYTWDAAQHYLRAQALVGKPFAPYARAVGIRQGWRMFLTGGREASREHIEIMEGGRWRTLYVRGSDRHRWFGTELDYHRLRKLCGFAVKGHEAEWEAFASFLARRAAREFPRASALRLRTELFDVPTAAETLAGLKREPSFGRELVVPLEGLR